MALLLLKVVSSDLGVLVSRAVTILSSMSCSVTRVASSGLSLFFRVNQSKTVFYRYKLYEDDIEYRNIPKTKERNLLKDIESIGFWSLGL